MMNELTYTQNGDYLIPDLKLEHTETKPLGKYGRMRRAFLQEIDETAHRRVEQLMNQYLQKNPAPDKATNQLGWVQHMNALKAQAEEVVMTELINS